MAVARVLLLGLLVVITLPVALPRDAVAEGAEARVKPMLGRSFVIRAMHGTVEVRPSPSAGYLRVRGTRSFPLGAEVDVTHGRARIVVAQDRRGTVNQATVTLGAFELTQEFERTHRVLKNTHLRMIGGDFSGCDGAVSS